MFQIDLVANITFREKMSQGGFNAWFEWLRKWWWIIKILIETVFFFGGYKFFGFCF